MISPAKTPWIYAADMNGFVLQKIRRKQSDNNMESVSSPFISEEKILTAQVSVKKSKQNFTDNSSYGIAILHPYTMELCSIQLGSAVLICKLSASNAKQVFSFKAWPSFAISPGKVALSEDAISSCGMKEDESIHVWAVVDNVVAAESVDLIPTSSDTLPVNSDYLQEYITSVIRSRYFLLNQVTLVEYFGKKIPFQILLKRHKVAKESSYSPLIKSTCEEFSNFSLGDGDTENSQSVTKASLSQFRRLSVFQITENTKVIIYSNENRYIRTAIHDSTPAYSRVGGLSQQIKKLKNLAELALDKPKTYKESGLNPPSGIILYGPPGTGKTLLLKSCSQNVKCTTFAVDIAGLGSDEREELIKCFNSAIKSSPSLILLDNIDAMCQKSNGVVTGSTRKLDVLLSNLLDKVSSHNKTSNNYVVVLAATNSIESINPALRRSDRFECEIEIPIPSPADRIEIFQRELNSYKHSLETKDISLLADKAHGYVGSDIAAVCKEAGRIALERCVTDQSTCKEVKIGINDLERGLKTVPPSAIRELIVQVPKVLWSDIGGNADVKKKLKQTIEWPLKHPEAFKRLGIDAPGGVLLYGPPGCSKTLTAKALATESGLNFISIKGPELFSKYVGDSEKAIRRIFAKARAASPSIIFIDELDAIAGERTGKSSGNSNMTDRVLATLLTELDGVETRQDVVIVAATNRPDKIDKALLRPGRIDRIVHVPLPDAGTRRDILSIQFKKIPVLSEVNVDWLVDEVEGYSGAEICAVCREAALSALERDMDASSLNVSDFEAALAMVHPQTTTDIVKMYEEYAKTFLLDLK